MINVSSFFLTKDEHKVNTTENNLNTSIYMPLAELRRKKESNSEAYASKCIFHAINGLNCHKVALLNSKRMSVQRF